MPPDPPIPALPSPADKTVRPGVQKSLEAQQDIDQQGHPHLPAHGVGAVAEEIAELEGLLDLLEEDLDLPAAEVGHGCWGPVEVVGQKLQHRFLAVEFDQGGHAGQAGAHKASPPNDSRR